MRKKVIDIDYEKVEQKLNEFNRRYSQESISNFDKEFKELVEFLTNNVTNLNITQKVEFCNSIFGIISRIPHGFKDTEFFLKMIMRLCNKNAVDPTECYKSIFPIVGIDNKVARSMIQKFIISDVEKRNLGKYGEKVSYNKKTQLFLMTLADNLNHNISNTAAKIFVRLYRKNLWTNDVCIGTLARACLHKSNEVCMTAVTFFLNRTKVQTGEESNDESDTELTRREKIEQIKLAHRVGKKSQARRKHMEKELSNLKQKKKSRKNQYLDMECNVQALNGIKDPQDWIDKLFKKTVKCRKYYMKLHLFDLISRAVGYLKLDLPDLYSYMIPLLTLRTEGCTKYLVNVAQAAHDEVVPDAVESVVKAIMDQFINEGVSGDAMTLGFNTIRELCVRCPYAMTADTMLLLIDYKDNRDKNVSSAARSLLNFYREVNPDILPAKYRGMPKNTKRKYEDLKHSVTIEFGKSNVMTHVPGAEILAEDEEMDQSDQVSENDKVIKLDDSDESDAQYESCSEDDSDEDDDEEGWIDVDHSDDEQKPENKKRKIEDMTEEERIKKAQEICDSRILSQKDLAKIKRHRRKMAAGDDELVIDESDEEDEESSESDKNEWVAEDTLLQRTKNIKNTKKDRLDAVIEGRIDRKKYGYKKRIVNENASTTNQEKSKKKNFLMIRRKRNKKKTNTKLTKKQKAILKHKEIMERVKSFN